MTTYKSNIITINRNDLVVFNFLNDFNNFGKLMPEQVVDWQAKQNRCSFTIKGMADLAMKLDRVAEYSLVSYLSEPPSPFEFKLIFTIEEKDNRSAVQLAMEAALSPMLKLMAARPLQNFVQILVEKLKEELESKA